ncbi:MAG: hypothetical protein H7287_00845 [Thermoleophilia bacterium]|nr:hypothetical protein [Thermoleophilia bacterium]
MSERAYRPFVPGRRPGGRPDEAPRYRVVVHHKFANRWDELPGVVGLESAQQFYDHVATTPGAPPRINTSTVLRGQAGKPRDEGFSRTIHYEISGAGRINYQHCANYRTSADGDAHAVVFILTIDLTSH